MGNKVLSAPDHTFHRSFYVGACLKGLQGILEALGGVLLWFLNPKMLHDVGALFLQKQKFRFPIGSSFFKIAGNFERGRKDAKLAGLAQW